MLTRQDEYLGTNCTPQYAQVVRVNVPHCSRTISETSHAGESHPQVESPLLWAGPNVLFIRSKHPIWTTKSKLVRYIILRSCLHQSFGGLVVSHRLVQIGWSLERSKAEIPTLAQYLTGFKSSCQGRPKSHTQRQLHLSTIRSGL